MNACGHHHVGHIGILGVDKKGEWYQISLGGSSENDAALGDILGPSVRKTEVANTPGTHSTGLCGAARGRRALLDTFRRIGLEPFRVRAYAPGSNEAKQEEKRYAVGY